MHFAPIALFVFKRPAETLQTLEHLALNPGFAESELFVFCDAARNPAEEEAVRMTRKVVYSRTWNARTKVIERQQNMGLARSIIAGVTQLAESHGRVIVFEDDLLAARGTLRYFNEALERYKHDDQVMQISAHTISIPDLGIPTGSFFLPLTTSWGWATWDRAWKHVDIKTPGWERLALDPDLRYRFNMDGSYYYAEMLEKQHAGKVDSWAVCWRWNMFQRQGLTLYPSRTLIKNIGFGNAATHTKESSKWLGSPDWQEDHEVLSFPDLVKADEICWRKTKGVFWKAKYPSLPVRIFSRIKRMFYQPFVAKH
jgi:hypothetical protein